MTEEKKKRKTLGLTLGQPSQAVKEHVKQNLSHGRSKSVVVEVKRKVGKLSQQSSVEYGNRKLTDEEHHLRFRAVQDAMLAAQEAEAVAAAEAEKNLAIALEQKNAALLHKEEEGIEELSYELEPLSQDSLPISGLEFSVKENRKQQEAGFTIEPSKSETKGEARGVFHERKRKEDQEQEELKRKNAFKGGKKRTVKTTEDQEEEEENDRPRATVGLKKLRKKMGKRTPSTVNKTLVVRDAISLSELADRMGKKADVLVKALGKMGMTATLKTLLERDTVDILGQSLGITIVQQQEEDREEVLWNLPSIHPQHRSPVVTIMGHVDHGKTSLLDALRHTRVASQEVGGITQHIGAYQVTLDSGKCITFIDTPGHEAFTQMRARGASTTDIVVLVVAADDGIKTQTVEAIRHTQAAGVPLIVAINKMDKPDARPDTVRQELLSYNIVVEKLGGEVQDVEISAIKRLNLNGLEEAILLEAELLDLKADPSMRAKGVVLETHTKKGHGIVATVLVQEGCLKKGSIFTAGTTWGRVRLLFDYMGKPISGASPSQPVEVVGFSGNVQPGDRFMVMETEAAAKDLLFWKEERQRKQDLQQQSQDVPAVLTLPLTDEKRPELPLILKADAQGSLEGLLHEIQKIHHEEVTVKILHQGVGPINESDALLAQTTQSTLVAFNVSLLPEARKVVEQKKIAILSSPIVYNLVGNIKGLLSGLLSPTYEEEHLGIAEVVHVFHVSRASSIAGCKVKDGLLRRNALVRVFRKDVKVYEGKINSLRHVKNDMREVMAGYECGVVMSDYEDFQEGDILKCFIQKAVQRFIS